MRVLVAIFFMISLLFAYSPQKIIKASGNVIDIAYEDSTIFVGTDNGLLEVFDTNSSKVLKQYKFEKIKDFSGELIGPKVFSVDKIKGKDIILCVLQGESFYRNLLLIENGEIKKLLGEDKHLMIKKAKFINENQIILALISNEILLYDIKKDNFLYKKAISQSQFSDFALSKDKSKMALGAESGIVNIIDTKTGKTIEVLEDGNVDNIYKIAYRNGKVLTAGQDRRAILYDEKSKLHERYNASFLIYACALSDDASLGAFPINQHNDIGLFDFSSKRQIATLKGQKSTLNSIVFLNKQKIVSGSDDKYIMVWSLK